MVPMTAPPYAVAAPAGWYPDPAAPGGPLRWWDGRQWTDWQAIDGQVLAAPLPPAPPGVGQTTDWTGEADHRAQWPRKAVGFALGMMVLSFLGGGLASLVTSVFTDIFAVELAVGMLVQTAGLYLACRSAKRRWGTDADFATDIGLRYGKGDWWRGLIASVGARTAGGVASSVIVLLLLDQFDNEPAEVARTEGFDWPALITFGIVALVVAPVVEELFFRGLLQRALESMVPTGWAIVLQGVVFGMLHGDPTAGMINLLIIVPIGVAGMGFGFVLHRYKRLGPAIAAHAWFNAVAVVVLLATGPS